MRLVVAMFLGVFSLTLLTEAALYPSLGTPFNAPAKLYVYYCLALSVICLISFFSVGALFAAPKPASKGQP